MQRDLSGLEIAMDTYTKPFWQAAAQHQLRVPKCGDCGTFRWPPGPFCPECRSQATEWVDPGDGTIFSFTILPVKSSAEGAPNGYNVPTLVRFANAGGTII